MKAATRLCLFGLVTLFTVISVSPIAGQTNTQAPSAPFNAFYTFGDSLADNGNDFLATQAFGITPAVPPSVSPNMAYYRHRFSNGPVAFEYLWQLISGRAPDANGSLRPFLETIFLTRNGIVPRAVNFSFGGSGTGFIEQTPGAFPVPGLRGQVELFRASLGGRPPSPRALYAIFAGAGDYLSTTPMTPAESVGNIIAAIQRLYATGARTVMVLNLPDLGLIPMTAGTPQSGALSELSRAHNMLLASSLGTLQANLPDLNLIPIDVNVVLQQLPVLAPGINVMLPALDALLPVPPPNPPMSTCVFVNPATCRDVPTFNVGLQFLFWDAEHPTTGVHQLLGTYLFQQLTGATPAFQTTTAQGQ